jgi:hypothetical protein
MDCTTNISKFYKQLTDFKDKLIQILHSLNKENEIIKLENYYNKLIFFKKANVRKPIELFYEHGIIPYVRAIAIRDDNFLLGKLDTLDANKSSSIDETDMFFISQIKGIWNYLSLQVKKNMWDYIQIICLLAEKIVGNNLLQFEFNEFKNKKILY